jgi:hypothetical protein
LEKRIRKIEESLQNPVLTNNATTSSSAPLRQDSMQSITTPTMMGAPSTATNKRPQGASSDPIQYLGDMSSFQFFSNKIHLDDNNTKWKGQYIRRFGKQVVLIEDGKEEENKQAEIPQNQLLPHVQPIHYWIYSVTGADRHTSDRLLKM